MRVAAPPRAHFYALGDERVVAHLPAELHAVDGEGEQPGTFTAVVSTFNTIVEGLFYDQMLKPGCFEKSIANAYPAPVWDHEWSTPPIGACLDCRETTEGAETKTRLFIGEDEDSPRAREVYTAMRAKNGDGRHVLREFSIGFRIVEAEWEVHDEREVLAIEEVIWWEYGPTLVGRNTSRLVDMHAAGSTAAGIPDPKDDPVLQKFGRPPSGGTHAPSPDALALARAVHLARPRV